MVRLDLSSHSFRPRKQTITRFDSTHLRTQLGKFGSRKKRDDTITKEPFDFDQKTKKAIFDVEGLIPSGTMLVILSKSGIGKSFLAEYLAVCYVYGHNFLGRRIEPSSVLLIDQDTPEETLYTRIRCFAEFMRRKGMERKRNLFVESMNGYSLSDGSLVEKIQQYDRASVVIIDSLHSVAGNLDVNSTKDMARLSKLKEAVIGEGKTLILVHHISEHTNITADEIMTTQDTNRLTMGNSIINQQADTLFYLASEHRSNLTKLFIRPVPKRVKLSTEPLVARLMEYGNSMHFRFDGLYQDLRLKQPKEPLFECDKDVLRLFMQNPKRRKTYQVLYDMGSKHSIYSVRASLKKLVERGYLKENKKSKRIFQYELERRVDRIDI